jgi:hypothetical protein
MEKAAIPAEILGRIRQKGARAARLARLRAAGRAEGVDARAIDAAEASLAGAFALGDFMDAIRRAAGSDD